MEEITKKQIYKKWWFLLIVLLVIVGIIVISISINKTQTTNTVARNQEQEKMTAEEIVNKLKEKGLSIGKIVVYTEETDLNNLLGRPNQYTSKIIFEDIRLEQVNANNEFLNEEERNEPTGGTIEVFNNKADMEKRKNYVETLSSSASIFNQYIYANDYAILRLENELTPTQAQEYEKVFNEIMNK